MMKALPHSLRIFLAAAVFLTAVCALAEIVCVHLGFGYPYTLPVLPRYFRFPDLLIYEKQYQAFHSKLFFDSRFSPNYYPAPATLVYKVLFSTGHAVYSYLGMVAATTLGIAAMFYRALTRRGLSTVLALLLIVVTSLTSYPLLFLARQGNIEIVLFAMVALAIFAFARGRYTACAVLIGIAGSMKIYPVVLLGLLIARSKYRQIAYTALVFAAVTVVSVWLVCPDFAYSWRHIQDGVAQFQREYSLGFSWTSFDHSIFGLIKSMADPQGRFALVKSTLNSAVPNPAFTPHRSTRNLEPFLHAYFAVIGLAATAVFFVTIRRRPVVNQILFLVAAMVSFPPTSYDYTLMHLYLPWGALCLCSVEQGRKYLLGLTAAFACFAVLFTPQTEIILLGQPLGGQIKAVVLLFLLFLSARYSFPSSFDTAQSASWGTADPLQRAAVIGGRYGSLHRVNA